jgi:hypothetical protein
MRRLPEPPAEAIILTVDEAKGPDTDSTLEALLIDGLESGKPKALTPRLWRDLRKRAERLLAKRLDKAS